MSRDERGEGARLRAMLDIIADAQSKFMFEDDRRAVFDALLGGLLAATGSEYGFVGEVRRTEDGQPFLKSYAITNIAWNEATRRLYEENAPTGLEFCNLRSLFGVVLTSEQPVIANDPATDPRRTGIPEGHPPLRAFLGVPLERAGRMIGMAGLANRPGGYDEQVIEELRPLTSTCANLIEAHQRDLARRAAEERLELQNRRLEREIEERRIAEEALRRQQEANLALSAPVIQVWDGVIAMPVIGTIDARRAARMTERLLDTIVRTGARTAILDLTGVELVNASTAEHLMSIARAATLLGSRCSISGLGPQVARTLVELGVETGGLSTYGTLQDALRPAITEAMGRGRPGR